MRCSMPMANLKKTKRPRRIAAIRSRSTVKGKRNSAHLSRDNRKGTDSRRYLWAHARDDQADRIGHQSRRNTSEDTKPCGGGRLTSGAKGLPRTSARNLQGFHFTLALCQGPGSAGAPHELAGGDLALDARRRWDRGGRREGRRRLRLCGGSHGRA